jgi:hypothetical protein
MNERIWEIYGASLVGTADNGGDVLDPIKFAELIVRECAKVGGDFEYARLHDSLVEDHILKHFGVEE